MCAHSDDAPRLTALPPSPVRPLGARARPWTLQAHVARIITCMRMAMLAIFKRVLNPAVQHDTMWDQGRLKFEVVAEIGKNNRDLGSVRGVRL